MNKQHDEGPEAREARLEWDSKGHCGPGQGQGRGRFWAIMRI